MKLIAVVCFTRFLFHIWAVLINLCIFELRVLNITDFITYITDFIRFFNESHQFIRSEWKKKMWNGTLIMVIELFGISFGIGFLIASSPCGLFKTKTILAEEHQWYKVTHSWCDKKVHVFPKYIYPKVNVTVKENRSYSLISLISNLQTSILAVMFNFFFPVYDIIHIHFMKGSSSTKNNNWLLRKTMRSKSRHKETG